MKNKKTILILLAILLGLKPVSAQNEPRAASPKLAEIISKSLAQMQQKSVVPREQREQAYARLLEGQRYFWLASHTRSQAVSATNAKLAKEALQKTIELDPSLAEGYTALAELSWMAPPNNADEAILLASVAIKIDANNFGAHRLLAQLYTIISNINRGALDTGYAQKAITEWKEIARLDPRNAEAFAFLSELYSRTNKTGEQIEALRNWLASAAPIGNGFYGRIFQGASLEPEAASVKLGAALIETGQTKQAVEVLSRAVADNPENGEAIELLRQALESVDGSAAATAVQALQQAVFANPDNPSLIVLLAQVETRTGKINDATKLLRDATAKLAASDQISAANLQITLGDIYSEANRFDEAVAAFQNALTVRGVAENQPVTDDERDFAIRAFDKIIDTYKKANRLSDARATIERARQILGKSDLFADKKLISFYRETGKKQEALEAVRALRQRDETDYGLLKLEASILTETGKVDEAVALIKKWIDTPRGYGSGSGSGDGKTTVNPAAEEKFANYLLISSLYSQAKRNKQAVETASYAYSIAQGEERKQIAKLTLATAQQMSGDYKSAEETLRELLKQSPKNPIALNNLGYFLTERNERLEEALALIRKAVEIDPSNPSYLDSLGWAYFKLGKYDEAEKYLKKALRFDDSSPTIYEHLGDVYQKQGKPDSAGANWQKAVNLSFDAEEISRLKSKIEKKQP